MTFQTCIYGADLHTFAVELPANRLHHWWSGGYEEMLTKYGVQEVLDGTLQIAVDVAGGKLFVVCGTTTAGRLLRLGFGTAGWGQFALTVPR